MGEKDVEKKKKKRERDDGGSKDSTPKKSKKLNKDESGQKSSSKKKKPDETAASVKEKGTPIKENAEKSAKKGTKNEDTDTPKSSKKDKKRTAENGEETSKSAKSAKKDKKKKKDDENGKAGAETPSKDDQAAATTAPQENGTAALWGKPKGVRPFPKLSPIAQPLADKKLMKNAYKLIKKASKSKLIKRGVKEVVKSIRKKCKGVCVLAGDIAPVDVLSHVPILCEESDIPYIYVPSKEELGHSGGTKRPTSCTLVLEKSLKGEEMDSETKEVYQEVRTAMEKILKSSFT